jgi:hypothetical protein
MKSKIICVSMEINGYHIWFFFLQYDIFDLWVNNYFQLKYKSQGMASKKISRNGIKIKLKEWHYNKSQGMASK